LSYMCDMCDMYELYEKYELSHRRGEARFIVEKNRCLTARKLKDLYTLTPEGVRG